MLVLTRRETDAIQIGPDIIIQINHIRGARVRVGIDAPTELLVDRISGEQAQRLREEMQQARREIVAGDKPEQISAAS